jgi:hypothetical protein
VAVSIGGLEVSIGKEKAILAARLQVRSCVENPIG